MNKLRQIAQLGAPVLRQQSEPVVDIHAPEITSLISDMRATLKDSGGVGLAAPQIYEPVRVVIVASRPTARYPYAPEMQPTVMLNPSFQAISEDKEKDWEGCLSIPGIRSLVPRFKHIRVDYLSESGETVSQLFNDFVARVFQHEYDHLNGMVYLDRVDDNQDIVSEKEFLKIIDGR